MNARSTRRCGMLLAIALAGFLLASAMADDAAQPIIVRLDPTPENSGKITDTTHPQSTKTGFDIASIPVFKKKISAKRGQTLRIELPYAATGYAWDYVGPKPGTADQGAVSLTVP